MPAESSAGLKQPINQRRMKHKPECSSNIACLVYHIDGGQCTRTCDCGAEYPKKSPPATQPFNIEEKIKKFMQLAPEFGKWRTDRNLSASFLRAALQEAFEAGRESIRINSGGFIADAINLALASYMSELRKKIAGMKVLLKSFGPDHDYALDKVLALLDEAA
jgi:hypothetical protein